MNKHDRLVGVTPITIRRAAFYANLGLGTYHPSGHPHFDEVRVEPLYDIMPNPTDANEWAYGTRVAFFKGGVLVNYVEWSSRLVGVGGTPILKKVEE